METPYASRIKAKCNNKACIYRQSTRILGRKHTHTEGRIRGMREKEREGRSSGCVRSCKTFLKFCLSMKPDMDTSDFHVKE